MCQLVPKWGYNGEMPGKGGGLSTKSGRFADSNNTPKMEKVIEVVNGYIKENNKAEAYSYILHCGLPPVKQNWLISQIF